MESVLFLRCPQLKYIHYEPKPLSYQFQTEGVISLQKLEQMMQLLPLIDQRSITHDLEKIFEGHRLEQVIPYLEKDELGDFLRHVLYSSYDILDWSYIDLKLETIDRYLPTRWDIPKLELDQAFRSLFNTVILVKLTSEETRLFKKFFKIHGIPFDIPSRILEILTSPQQSYRPFSFSWLFEIYKYFIYIIFKEKRNDFLTRQKYFPLLEFFELQMEKLFSRFNDKNHVWVALVNVHSNLLLDIGFESFLTKKFMFEKMIKSIQKFPEMERNLVNLIIGTNLAKILNQQEFINLPLDKLISEINRILDLLFPTRNTNSMVDVFKNSILNYRIHVQFLKIIIEGFSNTLYLISTLKKRIPSDYLTFDYNQTFQNLLTIYFELAELVYNENSGDLSNLDPNMPFGYPIQFALGLQEYYWNHLYYLLSDLPKDKKSDKLMRLKEFLAIQHSSYLKYVEMLEKTILDNYTELIENTLDKMFENDFDIEDIIFSQSTEINLLYVLNVLLSVELPKFDTLKVFPIPEVLILIIKSWLIYFHKKGKGYEELFELVTPVLLELQASRIETEYINRNYPLALIHAINFFLFNKWKQQVQIDFLTIASNNKKSTNFSNLIQKFTETVQLSQNTSTYVQSLTTELSQILISDPGKLNFDKLMSNLFELESIVQIGKPQEIVNKQKISENMTFNLGQIAMELSELLSKLGTTSPTFNIQDLLVDKKNLIKIHDDIFSIPDSLDASYYETPIQKIVFPIKNEMMVAIAISAFPMIIEFPHDFFKS